MRLLKVITGLKLQGWKASVDLALDAHEKITDLPTVGWDVAQTDEGPILIEANICWGGNVHQIPASWPLGEAFSDIFLVLAQHKMHKEGRQV